MSDFLELKQILIKNTKSYEWENREIISVNALSSLLAFILYSRRTFPCKNCCRNSSASEFEMVMLLLLRLSSAKNNRR